MTDATALLDLLAAPDDALALVEPASGERTTYGELRAVAGSLARSLAAGGVEPGDAVAMSLANGPEIVAAFLGVVAAGAAAAPLNQAYTADEFRAYLEDLQPRAMLFLRGAESAARAACAALGVRQIELVGATTASSRSAAPPTVPRRPRDPDAVALLLHTSGTTSKPKGVPIRQRNLAASARAVAATYGLSASDASHCAMPLFHVHGLVASTLATLASGGSVIAPRRFSASSFWAECARPRRDLVLGRPDDPPHPALARGGRRGDHAGHALRFARSCSSALPGPLMAGLRGAFRAAARRGLRHDRGGAPDGVQPAAAGRAARRAPSAGRPAPRSRSSTTTGGRSRSAPSARCACAGRASSTPTAPTRRRRRRASATAGSAPATPARSRPTATSRWRAGSRS